MISIHQMVAEAKLQLLHSNGFTFNNFLKSPEVGYMVSLQGYERTFPLSDLSSCNGSHNFGEHQLWTYFYLFHSIVDSNDDYYFGGWISSPAGSGIDSTESLLVYLDISQNIFSRQLAIEEGKKRKQISIYDLYNDEVIYL